MHQARRAQRHGQPARLRRSGRPHAQQHESRLPTAAIVANPGFMPPARRSMTGQGPKDRAAQATWRDASRERDSRACRSVRVAEFTLPQLSGSIPSLAFGGSKDRRAEEGILHCAGHAQIERTACTAQVMRRLSGLPSSCRICRVYALTPCPSLTPPYRTVSTWPGR